MFSVIIRDQPSNPFPDAISEPAAIVTTIVGGLIVLIIFAVFIYIRCHNRRVRAQADAEDADISARNYELRDMPPYPGLSALVPPPILPVLAYLPGTHHVSHATGLD
jgi:hypothetical protein